MTPDPINEIARAIQLALGPAFLLTAIAGLLNVMAGRLSRIIDRGRVLASEMGDIGSFARESLNLELSSLERRRNLTSVAITGSTVFVSVIEPHGEYSPVTEIASKSKSSIAGIEVLHDDTNYTVISIEDVHGSESLFFLARTDASATVRHKVKIDGRSYEWTGPYQLVVRD